MTLELPSAVDTPLEGALARVANYPRLRFMGSKYRLAPALAHEFRRIGGRTAIDAFSGSGVVSYLLKALGYSVMSNDFLAFSATIARAVVENSRVTLSEEIVDAICGPSRDGRDFIQTKFDGLFLSAEDRKFLDSAWSHIDDLVGYERDIAISALVVSAARKQPRGVFTFTGTRYDDGRRDLRLPMELQFRERVADYNRAIFDNGRSNVALQSDVSTLPIAGPDIVYLDPPYAPPKDDADYMKRYHFLEGLSVYWRDVAIMEQTKTKKIAKRHTPFANKRTAEEALAATFERCSNASAIVLSYSSNAVPNDVRIIDLLSRVKPHIELHRIPHTYSFGTHATALRRNVDEFIFIARD